jgi:hypothetical protein
LCYLFAARAADLPLPLSTLFVDEEVYTWKAADLAAVSGYYLSDAAARNTARMRAEQCVRVRPYDERLRANWAFHTQSAATGGSVSSATSHGPKAECARKLAKNRR